MPPASPAPPAPASGRAGLTPPERYAALDGYRGVAACLVVLYHYNRDFQLGLDRWLPAVDRLNLLVDFFFVLSGFVVMTAYGQRVRTLRDYGKFLRRRVARLYPLHLLTLAAFVAVGIPVAAGLMRANHPEYLALAGLPANLLLVQSWGVLAHDSFNVPAWSISSEWLAYLVFPGLALAARRLPSWLNAALIGLAVLALALGRQHAGMRPWTAATYDVGALRALPTFFSGVLIATAIGRSGPTGPTVLADWRTVHALFVAALAALQFGAPDEVAIALLALVVAGAALAERRGLPTRLTSSVMQRLGAASYAIYMIHVLASIPVLLALRATSQLGSPVAAVAALATFALVLGVADILYRRFETPWRRRIAGEARDRGAPARWAPA